jgi:hypothetical protein
MLFLLFRGHNGPVLRAILGALLVVVGIVSHDAIFVGIGAVMVVWGGIGGLGSRRVRRQPGIGDSGRVS